MMMGVLLVLWWVLVRRGQEGAESTELGINCSREARDALDAPERKLTLFMSSHLSRFGRADDCEYRSAALVCSRPVWNV